MAERGDKNVASVLTQLLVEPLAVRHSRGDPDVGKGWWAIYRIT